MVGMVVTPKCCVDRGMALRRSYHTTMFCQVSTSRASMEHDWTTLDVTLYYFWPSLIRALILFWSVQNSFSHPPTVETEMIAADDGLVGLCMRTIATCSDLKS